MASRVLLARHGEIHHRWRGCCYGVADVGLSARGRAQSRALARRFAEESVEVVYTSDLRRAAYVAECLRSELSEPAVVVSALRERDFGSWERRSWQDIYEESGNAMDGMIDAPATWRPPAGETTFEMRDRILGWYESLTTGHPGPVTVAAVTHGGPIAALLGTLRGLPVREWMPLVPAWGEIVGLDGESLG